MEEKLLLFLNPLGVLMKSSFQLKTSPEFIPSPTFLQKDVIEVYKVICRVGLACKSLGKQTGTLLNLLNDADQVWNTLCGFFAGSSLMPEDAALDFSSGVLKPEPENNAKACGLCLLNIELRSKSFKQEVCPKLSYGGRNYHSSCANFWVNCVDPLLPALVLPQLL